VAGWLAMVTAPVRPSTDVRRVRDVRDLRGLCTIVIRRLVHCGGVAAARGFIGLVNVAVRNDHFSRVVTRRRRLGGVRGASAGHDRGQADGQYEAHCGFARHCGSRATCCDAELVNNAAACVAVSACSVSHPRGTGIRRDVRARIAIRAGRTSTTTGGQSACRPRSNPASHQEVAWLMAHAEHTIAKACCGGSSHRRQRRPWPIVRDTSRTVGTTRTDAGGCLHRQRCSTTYGESPIACPEDCP